MSANRKQKNNGAVVLKSKEQIRAERIDKIKDACRISVLILAGLLLFNRIFFHIRLPEAYKAFSVFGVGFEPYAELNQNEAVVYFFDTGQSDCSLIMTEKHNVLIDGGDLDSGNIITGALKALGAEHLDYVLISHPHVDHFGGMTEIFGNFSVGKVLMPCIPDDMIPRTYNYSKILAALEIYDIQHEFVKAGDRFSLGDSVLEIAAPVYNDYSELNNLSIVARFVHGENAFLFTGDLEQSAERDILENGANIGAKALKVGHHGSAGSSSTDFLKSISPEIAVAEAGIYNIYGHPRSEIIERLSVVGCSEFCSTSLNGNIAIISDGKGLRVLTEKNSALSLEVFGEVPQN